MNMNDAWVTVNAMLRGYVASIPRLLTALLLALVFYYIGRLVRRAMERTTTGEASHRTLKIALGRIAHAAISVVGLLIAVTAAFPAFTPGNLVSALGIGGIAIGFAFKDIFENFLAGILILLTRPFRIGDQIIYDRFEGTVEDIQTRATWLKTYDGRRIVIPNSELFKNSVTVNTAFGTRRLEYDFKIAANADIERARKTIVEVMRNTPDVLPDPRADVVVVSFDQANVTVRARWWSRSHVSDVLLAQDRVLSAARRELERAGIALPTAGPQIIMQNQAPPAREETINSQPEPLLAKDQPTAATEKP